ncbi:RNA polymerase-associated protein RTF1 homolog [Galendromus occidentalis]|uniref:RNA polymerase-associated protein RTF1 homolog n=1 Tax=Galendromus occidentalis TaxID=34638 RepID=A0AAJ6QUG4_9ACAR|nr:RNA polymerase-associated protein RTF1 homolog [Galendromus occidentalis]
MSKRKSRVALASDSEGSAASSDEDRSMANKKPRVDDDDDATSDSGDEWGTKGKKKVLSKKASPKDNSDKNSDYESEEGEITDDSVGGSDVSEEFNDGYDENLMGDEEDQARLAKMTEKEREQEIYNRIEKRERLRARFEIEKKLRQAKKKQESKEKQFTDVSMRSKERKKNLEGRQDKKSQAIQSLKAEREKKKKAEEERKEKEDTKKDSGALKKLKASDIYSDDDSSDSESDSDASSTKRSASRSRSRSRSPSRSRSSSRSRSRSSDSDSDSASSRHSEERVVHVNTRDQLSQIRLSRFRLEKWLFMPFFAKTVVGCFVKIGVGQMGGAQNYRIAEILEVVETPKVYQCGKNRTNRGLKLKHGKEERIYRIEYVSNQEFTENEFQKWMAAMGVDNIGLPTVSFIEKKKKDLEAANNHSCSANDIQQMVDEKKKFKKNPHNYAMAKTEVMKKKEMAEQQGDQEEARKWSEELDRLEDRAKELDKQRTSTISAIAYINERNRQKNIVDIERAILEEAKKNKLKADDPFTRRKCAPSLVTKKNVVEKISSEQLKTLEEMKKKDQERRRLEEENQKREADELAKKKRDSEKAPRQNGEDLFTAHDFDIKIDLDSSIPSASVAHPIRASFGGTSFLRDTAPKRSLNLEEYKKKRGLI